MSDRGVRAGLAALVGLLAIACVPLSPNPTIGPGPGATPDPTQPNEPATTIPAVTAPPVDEPAPTATDDGTAGTPPCEVFDLKVSHGLVEATADTRTTEVVLVAGMTCSVDSFPTFGLVDGKGKQVTVAEPGGSGALDLVLGVAYKSELTLTSWCAADPAFPVNLRLVVTTGTVDVTGEPFLDGDVPTCVGDAGPTIEASAWEPSA